MSITDKIFKRYSEKLLASDKANDVKNNLKNWIDNNNELIDAILNSPINIDKYAEEFRRFCHQQANMYTMAMEETSSTKLMSFADFDNNPLDEGLSEREIEEKDKKDEELQKHIEQSDDYEDVEEIKDEEGPEKIESKFIATSSIKPDKFDWYTFSGARRKRYRYGSNEWTLNPGGIVGISKAKDFRNKHSFCILDQSKSQTIDITTHNADLLRKKCKPYRGNIAQIITPTPSSRRVATASKVRQFNEIKADVENFYDIEEHDNGDYSFCPKDENHKIAVSDMVKYLSNIFEIEPVNSDEESTHWETKDGDIVLKYQPDFKYVVTTRK